MTRTRKTEAGFSLLEMLVVLVIVTLISGILFSGFDRLLDLRLRLAAFLDGVDAPTLVADWFRASIDGLMPDTANGPDRFSGGPYRLSGLSVAPLDATAGVPIRITWELVYEPQAGRTYLRYRNEGGSQMTIASWPGERGRLRYCGAALLCSDAWPPAAGAASQLPALIELDAVRGTEAWPIIAAPHGDRNPAASEPRLNGAPS